MHFRVLLQVRDDGRRNLIFANTQGLMHSAPLAALSSSQQNMFRGIKEKAEHKIILPAFYQAPAFSSASEGRVSPPASLREVIILFPVTGLQMISNHWGAFLGAQLCQQEVERALIFRQLHMYFHLGIISLQRSSTRARARSRSFCL